MISTYATQNWLTLTLVFLVAILVLLHFLYEKRFKQFISIYKINEYFVDYINKKASFFSVFNSLLFFILLGNYSLFLYIIFTNYKLIDNTSSSFIKILTVLLVYLISRYLIGKLISFIFGIDKIQGVLSFVKFTYLAKVAIYIFPFVILLVYLPFNILIFQYISIGFTVLILLFFYLKLLAQNQKLIFRNLIYFILYLCTLEITPLIYFFKAIIFKDE